MQKNLVASAAAFLFLLGIFTCTWDLLLTAEVGGFTLKIHQLCFFLSALLAVAARWPLGWPSLLAPWREGFAIFFLGLVAYYGLTAFRSEFPLKSALYSGWVLFDLVTIWYAGQLQRDVLTTDRLVKTVWWTLIFLSLVIVVDQVAYQFGNLQGLLGYNQDAVLKWGVSRPHAFSFEPSYVAVFMSLAILFIYPFRLSHPKALIFLGIATAIYALVSTTSRTGWVSLTLGFIFIFGLETFRTKNFPWSRIFVAISCAALALAIFYFSTPNKQRDNIQNSLVSSVYQGTDGSGKSRLRSHQLALQIAQEKDWLGTGLGASYRYWVRLGRDTFMIYDDVREFTPSAYGKELIMSTWGQVLAEGGLPGFLLYLGAALALLRYLWRHWWRTGNSENLNALSSALVFFGLVAFLIGNIARGDVWVWFSLWTMVARNAASPTQARA